MRAEAAVIHGTDLIEVRSIELPAIGPDELLLRVVSSSMCLSTSKALRLGPEHKRVPETIAEEPVITGHEFAGVIEQVGADLAGRFTVGQAVAIQPAMGLPSGYSPGYSYPHYGGDTTHCVIPALAIDKGCVLPYDGTYFADASLAEPMSCVIGAFHASYHTTAYVYEHRMGIRRGGTLAVLGAGGAMGVAAVDYALHGPYRPRTVVAVDVSADRLARLERFFPVAEAAARGVDLVHLDATGRDLRAALLAASGGAGFDDVLVMVAQRELVETAGAVLAPDGCLNFFAGPTDRAFTAEVNFYDVHYEGTHLVGTSGAAPADMQECLDLTAAGALRPSLMVTHVGGLGAVPGALTGLPSFTGGKILIYPHADLPLTAIDDLAALGVDDERYAALATLCAEAGGVWNARAEAHLLSAFTR